MKKKYIYIPIEVKKREFLAKIILGYYAANSGYTVIIGQSTILEKLYKFAPRGIYIGTSIVEQHRKLFEKIKNKGSQVIAIDEEGLVYYNKENFLQHRVNEKTLALIDGFITWGNHHTELVKSKYNSDYLYNIGNIRFEILKPKYHVFYNESVHKLKQKYNKYILINTNFAAYNNYKNVQEYKKNLGNLVTLDKKDLKFYEDKIKHQEFTFFKFIALANQLSDLLPDHKVIIRPHPSENISHYLQYVSNDIIVNADGNVIPWILGADCVIQQNCTTAIEAICLGTPVLSYLPNYDQRFDEGLPNKLAPCVFTESEILSKVKKIIIENYDWKNIYEEEEHENIADYISNMNLENNMFLQYIKVFDEMIKETNVKSSLVLAVLLYKIEVFLLNIFNKERRKNKKYIKQKFNHASKKELINILNELNNISNQEFNDINVTKLCSNAFLIRK